MSAIGSAVARKPLARKLEQCEYGKMRHMATRVCIFGASVTWGAIDPKGGGWVDRLKRYWYESSEGEVQVFNLAIGGDDTEMLLRRIRVETEARKPSLTIIALGTGDSKYIGTPDHPQIPLEQFRKNLAELVVISQETAKRVVFVGLTPCDESKTMPVPWDPDGLEHYDNTHITLYDNAIREFCKREEIPYVDLWDIVALDELVDGIHPNAEGHRKIFEVMKEEVKIPEN